MKSDGEKKRESREAMKQVSERTESEGQRKGVRAGREGKKREGM